MRKSRNEMMNEPIMLTKNIDGLLVNEIYRPVNICEKSCSTTNKTGDDLVSVIRCKDCGYFNTRNLYCNRPCEAIVARDPWDYCSKARRRVKR